MTKSEPKQRKEIRCQCGKHALAKKTNRYVEYIARSVFTQHELERCWNGTNSTSNPAAGVIITSSVLTDALQGSSRTAAERQYNAARRG